MGTTSDFEKIEIKGREFTVKKFDARTGSYMLIKVMGILAPMIKVIDFKQLKSTDGKGADGKPADGKIPDLDSIDITGVISSLSELSEQDFEYIQAKCLGVCYEPLDSGLTKVMNSDGSFGVIGLDNDTMTVMALTAHALIFNVTSFFGGSPLSSIMGAILSSN